MKLISYTHNNKASFGHQATSDKIIDIASKFNYVDVLDFISKDGHNNQDIINYIKSNDALVLDMVDLKVVSPIKPRSLRDAYAFRQHVEAGRKNRELEMIPEYDEFPVFYFSPNLPSHIQF